MWKIQTSMDLKYQYVTIWKGFNTSLMLMIVKAVSGTIKFTVNIPIYVYVYMYICVTHTRTHWVGDDDFR